MHSSRLLNVAETKRQEETEEVRKILQRSADHIDRCRAAAGVCAAYGAEEPFWCTSWRGVFVVGTLFVTVNICVKKPVNSTLAVRLWLLLPAILKIFHIFSF